MLTTRQMAEEFIRDKKNLLKQNNRKRKEEKSLSKSKLLTWKSLLLFKEWKPLLYALFNELYVAKSWIIFLSIETAKENNKSKENRQMRKRATTRINKNAGKM